ncbi:hypothetical protein OVA24_16895 [Luteolibacter sp. SL250]|uniref:hypothetical protein n=1 Tax=Luteolibacter sp. SL250 TaxID=2995170 RepID=UPI00226F213E|nr:hypothetical protein [Luteolibacter sp. SL250]WAC18911.1 hypothetical protein OVA24_16895 [Luteolibacter sp. SL250]
MSDARLRRYFLGAACLWAVLNIAGGVWWLAVSWDEYRHLDDRWQSILDDLPDVFPKSVGIALAVAGFILFLGLTRRKRLPVYASLTAGGVTWFFAAFSIACLERFYVAMYIKHHSSGGSGFPRMSLVRTILLETMEITGNLLGGWKMPLAFALLTGLGIYGVYRIPWFQRWFIRPASAAPVGLAVGVVVVLSWHWFHLPGWYDFSCGGYDYPEWLEVVLGAVAGTLHAFLFSGLTRYLYARMDYWEDRAP